MPHIYTILSFLSQHKYLCVIVFFALLIGVLDSNSLVARMGNRSQISKLNSEIHSLREACERDSLKLLQMNNDPEAVRKIARETYFMKYDNEDVYVFVDAMAGDM